MFCGEMVPHVFWGYVGVFAYYVMNGLTRLDFLWGEVALWGRWNGWLDDFAAFVIVNSQWAS